MDNLLNNSMDEQNNRQPDRSFIPDLSFEELSETMRAAARRAGWNGLMPVQARAIPYLLAGRDMLIQARTGSGKTGAFLLPMLEKLNPQQNQTQALILVPTRELAKQVTQEAETLCGEAGLRTVAVYGGVSYGSQNEGLKKGAQIVVGTPGRALDHLLRRTLSLDHLKMLVFDEADRMLSMGFYPDMRQMQGYLPKRKVHTCMFSATFPYQVLRTAQEFAQEPEFLTLSSDHVYVTETEHRYYLIPGMEKDHVMVRLIELENPTAAIIFCNTKNRVHYVTVVLQRYGYDADELSADLPQKERERVLERVRRGKLRFLVATDVAARGIDIPELSHVFQYEIPEDAESYIHRAGRTSRAGASGVAISLVSGNEKALFDRIAKRYEIEMEQCSLPTEEEVQAVVSERLTAQLEAKLRARDKLQTDRSHRFEPLARSLAQDDEQWDIITMLLDNYYQQVQHAPPPQPENQEPAGTQGIPKSQSRRAGGRQGGSRRPRRK
ncbi:MAG: DEAD/DEAH box helicase [Anaerolineales bacterium]|nr:DEAD/DEAH box helicase [Anaerolineales bacterium]